MPPEIVSFLIENEKLLYLLAGAAIGFGSSYVSWKINTNRQEKHRRVEHARNMVRLVLATGSFCRSLIYAKPSGIEAVGKLGPNPLDELMAYTMIHISDIAPFVQELNLIFSEIFIYDVTQPGAKEYLFAMNARVEELLNQTTEVLVRCAAEEKLEPDPSKKVEAEWKKVLSRYGK